MDVFCGKRLYMFKKADQNAKEILAKVFLNRSLEQVTIDGIASGSSIHCATQQEPII